jgi:hypothetical protein
MPTQSGSYIATFGGGKRGDGSESFLAVFFSPEKDITGVTSFWERKGGMCS